MKDDEMRILRSMVQYHGMADVLLTLHGIANDSTYYHTSNGHAVNAELWGKMEGYIGAAYLAIAAIQWPSNPEA